MGANKKQARNQRQPKNLDEDMEFSDEISEDIDVSEEETEKTKSDESGSPEPVIEVWPKLLSDFTLHINKAISFLRERDVDEIPGAKEELIARLTNIVNYFPKNDGVILQKIVSDSIERS